MSDKSETKIVPFSALEPRVIRNRVGSAMQRIGHTEREVLSEEFLSGDSGKAVDASELDQALRALRGVTFH